MTLALEGAVVTTVPLLPRGKELWERSAIPSLDTLLFRAPNCPDRLAEAAVRFSISPPQDLQLIGKGTFSRVYDYEETALKLTRLGFAAPSYRYGQFNDFIANLAFRRGLQNIPQPPSRIGRSWRAIAPEMYAVALPLEHCSADRSMVCMMDMIPGTIPAPNSLLPHPFRRALRYGKALAEVGVNPSLVNLDDKDDNMMLLPSSRPETVEIAKFDVITMGPIVDASLL